jgi:hypothetical protein
MAKSLMDIEVQGFSNYAAEFRQVVIVIGMLFQMIDVPRHIETEK